MERKYSDSQIRQALEEVAQGAKVKDVCRKYNITDTTYYNWKRKFSNRREPKPSTTRLNSDRISIRKKVSLKVMNKRVLAAGHLKGFLKLKEFEGEECLLFIPRKRYPKERAVNLIQKRRKLRYLQLSVIR